INLDFQESKDPRLKGGQQQPDQIQFLRSFIKENVDVIAFSPVVQAGWKEVLNEAAAHGIPVILSDRGVSEDDQWLAATFIGSDFREEGRRAARWLVQAFWETTTEVNVVEISGTLDSAPATQRHEGFCEVLSKPEYQGYISGAQFLMGDFDSDIAKSEMNSLLKSTDPKYINAVFAHSDAMAFGAIKALKEAGL